MRCYVALPLRSDDPVAAMRALGKFGLKGANVTVPHKEAAARAADAPDAVVQVLGAANTLHWKDGALEAFNTDCGGFWRALSDGAPGWRKSERVLIVGAGGAARGIAYAMAGARWAGASDRQPKPRAGDAAGEFRRSAVRQGRARGRLERSRAGVRERRPHRQHHELGHGGRAGSGLAGRSGARRTPSCATSSIGRSKRNCCARPRARGLRTVDGLGMLIHQGARAFEFWFGVKPDAAKARARLLAELR